MTLDSELVDAYLARIGLDAEPPSADALMRLHRAHVENVPWETLWIHLGHRWPVAVETSAARIASGGGGYCYHLNGGFSALLETLGYDVRLHVGGVRFGEAATDEDMTNHLVLSVHGLPSDANPRGDWYVDVGLGDMLHEPTPLVPGPFTQGPFSLAMRDDAPGVGEWDISHGAGGSFAGVSWHSAPTAIDAFVERNEHLSNSQESWFVLMVIIQRRDATGADILRELTLSRVGEGAGTRSLHSLGGLRDALGDIFRMDVPTIEGDGLQRVYDRMVADKEARAAARAAAE
jgi:arylamine N-acetyltransferase